MRWESNRLQKKKNLTLSVPRSTQSHFYSSVWMIINHGSAVLTECVMKVKKLLVTKKNHRDSSVGRLTKSGETWLKNSPGQSILIPLIYTQSEGLWFCWLSLNVTFSVQCVAFPTQSSFCLMKPSRCMILQSDGLRGQCHRHTAN